jgi:Na+/melibiose symporter-like transporter
MLDLSFFKNPRFSAASGAIAVTFFSLFGALFVLTQYLQFVLGYSPLETGVRLLAFAIPMMIIAPLSPRFVDKLGTKLVVASGLTLSTVGLLLSLGLDESSSYGAIAWRMVVLASGMALTMAPSTTAIMGSLPLAKAGVGSAVNDTTRQVGGTLGVAVVGSVFASVYASQVGDAFGAAGVPAAGIAAAKDSVGAALAVAAKAPGAAANVLADAARSAFIDGMHTGLIVGAGVALLGAIAVLIWLPARARAADVERQDEEYQEGLRAMQGDGAADGDGAREPAPVAGS